MSAAIGTTALEIPARVLARAKEAFDVNEQGCWISTYSTGSHGYGQIGWWERGRSRMITHHRAMWTAVVGPVPEGMTIDHVCLVKRCVNPAHLRVLSVEQNCRRGNRAIDVVPEGRCLYGHAPESLRRYTRIVRGKQRAKTVCIECKRERENG